MAQFMVHVSLKPEECPCEFETDNPNLKGRAFFCTCPSGTHGGFIEVEANTPEEAIGWFPDEFRRGATAYSGETMTIS